MGKKVEPVVSQALDPPDQIGTPGGKMNGEKAVWPRPQTTERTRLRRAEVFRKARVRTGDDVERTGPAGHFDKSVKKE